MGEPIRCLRVRAVPDVYRPLWGGTPHTLVLRDGLLERTAPWPTRTAPVQRDQAAV